MQPDSADARHLVADVGGTHARFAGEGWGEGSAAIAVFYQPDATDLAVTGH